MLADLGSGSVKVYDPKVRSRSFAEGQARACYDTMAKVIKRLAEVRDNVGFDSINVEKYVLELTNTMVDLTKATWRMFE